MGLGSKARKQASPANLELAIACLRQERNAQAFALLDRPGFLFQPAARFALGLCYWRAQNVVEAIVCLSEALRLLKARPQTPLAALPPGETARRLAEEQVRPDVFLAPMDAAFCTAFPKEAGHVVLLALVHICRESGAMDRAQRLLEGLKAPEFAAFKANFLEEAGRG